jgi:uncharacterized integral membrane protein
MMLGVPQRQSGQSVLGSTVTNPGSFMVEQSPGDGRTTRRLTGGAIASLSAVALLVIFMIQNTDDVKLDFLFWSFTWPLWLLCLVMALVGAIAWFGLGVLRRHRRRKERRAARRG